MDDVFDIQENVFLPKLLETDPLTPMFQAFPGWIEYMEGHFEDALISIRKMYQMEPENPFHSLVYANFLMRIESLEEAFSVIDRLADRAQQTSLHGSDYSVSSLCKENEKRLWNL